MCRLHGAYSPGAPRGEANGNWKHGGETMEAVALRREVSELVKALTYA